MAEPNSLEQQSAGVGQQPNGATMEVSEFEALLGRELKPKSDRAREQAESAVRTLAEQVLPSPASKVFAAVHGAIVQVRTSADALEYDEPIVPGRAYVAIDFEARAEIVRRALVDEVHAPKLETVSPLFAETIT